VTGRCSSVEEEGQEAGGIIVIVDASAVDEGGVDQRVLQGEGFWGNSRAWERLVGQGWALFWGSVAGGLGSGGKSQSLTNDDW